jgi:RNA polymerase sigma factor (sigma-70 family)
MTEAAPAASDAALVAGALAGDDRAFRALVERHQRPVHACAWALTRNGADAADVAQETFIRFHRSLAQYDPRRPLRPYLLRIAANCSRNALAARARRAAECVEGLEALPDQAAGPAQSLVRAERRRQVRQLVDRLPATLREVTSLFYLAECSCREVAEALAMTETAVKVALHRARRRLLTELTSGGPGR